MFDRTTRRDFLKFAGISSAAWPFLGNLASLGFGSESSRKQRLVVIFSPNGVVPFSTFWPDEEGPLASFKESLSPLEPFRDRTLTLHGICDKIRGDGDGHMRGIGCLLTGIELLPGSVQGGSHTPAGWSSGISMDQELKNFLQSRPESATRFGSLEFGVLVPDRADTWTRMVYAGSNKPIAPISDPYQMLHKLYGQARNRENLRSILDGLTADFEKVERLVTPEDRRLLSEHAEFVRQMENELRADAQTSSSHPVPELEPGIVAENNNIPRLSRMQIDLLVHSFQFDFARIATLQFTNSVGMPRMTWLGIDEPHHTLSHEPDSNENAQAKLTKINKWYCEQVALLAQRLADTPEPGGNGSLLDNTTILWTNELGKGNSHTPDNVPFVLVGNGLGFSMGRSLKYGKLAHNRLLLSLAHAMGHQITTFGNPDFCGDGPLTGLV